MSKRELLLEVARGLAQPFSVGELTNAAFVRNPDLFGSLQLGAPNPDPHAVQCILCGRRGLVATGDLVRLGDGRYRVATDVEKATTLAVRAMGD